MKPPHQIEIKPGLRTQELAGLKGVSLFTQPNKCIIIYIISVENVENQLSRLNMKKATGPDNIPTCVLAGPVAWNSSGGQNK